jgi:hypothetical protein
VRILSLALVISALVFSLGFVVEGFWGGMNETNWVDQSFGLGMYLGAALAPLFAVLLAGCLVITGAFRLGRQHRLRRGDRART